MAKKKKSKTKKSVKQKIDKNMSFSEVLSKYPQSAEVMMSYGLHCIGCQVAAFETIQQGAKAHGMSDKELNKMIDDLNKAAEKKNEAEEPEMKEEPEELDEIKPKKKSFFKKLLGG